MTDSTHLQTAGRAFATTLLLCLLSAPLAAASLSNNDYAVLSANDLGMHCADLDYKIFSILPPFNVVHAQVIRLGDAGRLPRLMNDRQIEVVYSATSSPNDPAGADSINTTSKNQPTVFKTNFWNRTGGLVELPGSTSKQTLGGRTYNPLYPSILATALLDPPADLSFACIHPDGTNPSNSTGCPSILQAFESLSANKGLPVPDLVELANGTLAVDRQKMPGSKARRFKRFVKKQPFFTAFDFGQLIKGANWWAAEGIPILPIDDAGNINAYPLMKVTARDAGSGETLASLDVVLPVASEANCQNCHADIEDAGNGAASNFSGTAFEIARAADAPGPEKLNNAAKLNILRLHDAKHGMKYQQWNESGALVAAHCDVGSDPNSSNCLAKTRKVQCSRCHYSPALDLVHAGPVDEPALYKLGRQQTRHVTMSRAMHAHHGELPPFMGAPLFPDMPPADDPLRTASQNTRPVNSYERGILEDSCYQCHPGNDTQCLRGAMFSGGVVCQDCHGNMAEVGNDFSIRVSTENPGDFILDGSLRVPWASEPGCQSCHTGDAMNPRHPGGALVSADGLRLLRAYTPATLDVSGAAGPVAVAHMIQSPDSPFAENQGVNAHGDAVTTLYRLSTGHGGVKCEGCHNSTHAVWPARNSLSNDNIAARQLQGHTGTLIECSSCHGDNSFGIDDFKNNLTADGRMKGPHGMHPVNDRMWNEKHKEVDEGNRNSCRSCHGANGEGTVLSRVAKKRVLECEEADRPGCTESSNGKSITLSKGTQVSCTLCHDNYINGEDDD